MPEFYGRLTRLRTLDLGHNALKAVPDLSALTQLEILYLHENALTALPALPPSLEYLNISENPLVSIELGQQPNLIELRMLDLGLTTFPDVALPRLRELTCGATASRRCRRWFAPSTSCGCSTCGRTR